MNHTDSSNTPAVPSTPSKPRRRVRRIIAAVALVATGAAAGTAITAAAGGGWHHGHHRGPFNAEHVKDRANLMVELAGDHVDATDAQRERINAIVAQFIDSVETDVNAHRASRRAFMEVLSGTSVDRTALESLRADELARADAMSAQAVASLADIAEVLTPEQRAEVRGHLERFRR